MDGDRYATWDAAYVLGSLSSAERREYEAHLETCDRCRAAVAELSGMPALLGLLDVDDVRALDDEQPEPPPLRPEVLAVGAGQGAVAQASIAVADVGGGRRWRPRCWPSGW